MLTIDDTKGERKSPRMKRALPNSQRQVRLCLTKEGARLKSNAPGMDVFYQLPEDIRLKFFDNKRLVYISLRLPEEEEKGH